MLIFYLSLLEGDEDRERFTQIYVTHERMMYAVAYSILHSQMAAQDAVHNSFLKVIEHFETCRKLSQDELKNWLIVIVKHSAFDMRKKEARSKPFADVAYMAEIPVDDGAAEAEIGYAELVEKIRALPEIYRSVLELKYLAEWTDDEIAKALHLNASTIRSRLMRGRNLLRTSIYSTQV